MTALRLLIHEWASGVLRRLDDLPSILRQQETIGRLLTVIRALQDERDGLNKALSESRAEIHKLRHENLELQDVIVKRLTKPDNHGAVAQSVEQRAFNS